METPDNIEIEKKTGESKVTGGEINNTAEELDPRGGGIPIQQPDEDPDKILAEEKLELEAMMKERYKETYKIVKQEKARKSLEGSMEYISDSEFNFEDNEEVLNCITDFIALMTKFGKPDQEKEKMYEKFKSILVNGYKLANSGVLNKLKNAFKKDILKGNATLIVEKFNESTFDNNEDIKEEVEGWMQKHSKDRMSRSLKAQISLEYQKKQAAIREQQ